MSEINLTVQAIEAAQRFADDALQHNDAEEAVMEDLHWIEDEIRKVPALEARVAALTGERNEAVARVVSLAASVAALTEAIEMAPHADTCSYYAMLRRVDCYCWKATALAAVKGGE